MRNLDPASRALMGPKLMLRYYSFGSTRSGGAATPTDKRYTGQVLDASTGCTTAVCQDGVPRTLDSI